MAPILTHISTICQVMQFNGQPDLIKVIHRLADAPTTVWNHVITPALRLTTFKVLVLIRVI